MQYGLVVVWLLAYALLGLAALPVASWLFPRFADRGASLAIPIALAVLGLVGFLVGHLAFAWPALVAGTLALVAGSYLAGDVPLDERAFAESMAVFAAAFLFLVAIRAVDPSVHPVGGEKFLDFGLLKSLLRADALPPEDMWFAGEPVEYYYGGHVVAALLSRLTFTAPRYAYNLALSGFYAAMVTAVYGLAGNVAAATGARRRLAAGLGAFFAGVAANLETAARVALWALPPGVSRTVVSVFGLPSSAVSWTPAKFYYWDASRVILLNKDLPPDRQFGLPTEFPLFAWLNGDMHAHMMSTPFLLLVVGVAYAYWRTPAAALARRRLLVFGVLPPVVGFIGVVNTWSLPTAVGLAWLALTFADADPASLLPWVGTGDGDAPTPPTDAVPGWVAGEVRRAVVSLVAAAGVLAIALAWSAPFWLGLDSGRDVALFPERTRLGALVLIHGAFLAAFVPYLARRVGAGVTESFDRAVLGVGVFLVAGGALALNVAAVALFGPLLVAAWALLRHRRLGGDRIGDVDFETVLLVGGFGIVLLVEFVYVVERAGPERFNTVFKGYAQVWQLFAISTGVVLARLADAGDVTFDAPRAADWRRAGRALALVLVVLTALYAGFALPNHFGGEDRVADVGDPTLDATRFVEVYHAGEAPAIRWLDARQGTPTIVTAAPAGYRWRPSQGKGAAAPSSLTGVPTVAGWFHERGYRGPEAYRQRVEDVRVIYEGAPADQADLLRTYDVRYVYVGPAERAAYDVTVTDLRGVDRHRQLGDVTIYRVTQDELPT